MKIKALGSEIPVLTDISRGQIRRILQLLKFIFFDVDGCLINISRDSSGKRKTVKQYLKEHSFEAAMFESLISIMALDGLQFGICTGRSHGFVQPLADLMFPPGTCKYLICEGGAVKVVYNEMRRKWERQTPGYLDPGAISFFDKHKSEIIEIGVNKLGGYLEPGKDVITSFNAPIGMKIENYRDLFAKELKSLGIIEELNFENSSTAVDVGPKGVNKVSGILEVAPATNMGYVGDAVNDSGAMRECFVTMVPKNGSRVIKNLSMQCLLNLTSPFVELAGTTSLIAKIQELRS